MNIVFSKHARERMVERQISEELVIWTVLTPDRTYFEDDGDTKFIRRMDGGNIHVVCKPLPEEEKWLVKSVWFRPLNERRQRPRYKSAVASPEPQKSGLNKVDFWLIVATFGLIILGIVLYALTR
jgi:hypothetical protein